MNKAITKRILQGSVAALVIAVIISFYRPLTGWAALGLLILLVASILLYRKYLLKEEDDKVEIDAEGTEVS